MENNEATISDDVREKFFWFGVTALSKALVFRTLAKQTFENREYILTSISGYYSLFHLAMAIMYLCPQLLSDKQLKGILKAIEKTGGLDPSEGGYRFRHKEALNFIGKCVSEGLNKECHSLMEEAERLRVFVNYGPRMSLKTPGTPHFDSCEKQSKDVDNLIGQLDDCLLEAIK